MQPSRIRLFDAPASRAIDARAIAEIPVAGFDLMQRAASFAFDCLLNHWPGLKTVSVLCGKGNNAGDAYLVAELARKTGIDVELIAVQAPDTLQGDAARAYAQAQESDLTPLLLGSGFRGEVIVDGLLGTGVRGEVGGDFERAIEAVNASGLPVLAIDVPSGIHAGTGAVCGTAVEADVTVSFITRKVGLYTGAGVSYAGVREYSDLGVPGTMIEDPSMLELMYFDPASLPRLDSNTYKHRQGHVLVMGGDTGMPGAVAMAAEAALRVGAGMVSVATRPEHAAPIIARTPEVMVANADGDDLDALFGRVDTLVLGPGLGRAQWGERVFSRAMTAASEHGLDVVVDADGLYWLHGNPARVAVITPHIAEAARLLETSAAEVQQDRVAAARELRQRFANSGVLKGAGSILFGEDGVAISAHGNPGMATAGMGDVLSGMVGGFVAQNLPVEQAVLLHSAAADKAAAAVGQRSLVATDVTRRIPELLE